VPRPHGDVGGKKAAQGKDSPGSPTDPAHQKDQGQRIQQVKVEIDVRPHRAFGPDQDSQGDAQENTTVENEERTAVLDTVAAAAAGAHKERQKAFRQHPHNNYQLYEIVEDQKLSPQQDSNFGFELYPVLQ
jgi:hypothetical protein